MEGVVRVTLYVILLTGLFAGAVAYAGNRLGAFDPVDPPPIPVAPDDPSTERAGKKKDQKAGRVPERHAPAGWVARVNAVCADLEPAIAESGLRLVRATQRQDWDALARAWLAAQIEFRAWNDRLARLGSPAGLEATWRRLLRLLATDERLVDGIVAAVRTRDVATYAGLLADGAANDEAEDELFLRLGADRCTFAPLGTA